MTLQRRLRAEQKLCRKARAERNATRGRHPEWSGCRLCFFALLLVGKSGAP